MHLRRAKFVLAIGWCLLASSGGGCATSKPAKWYDPFGLFAKEKEGERKVVTQDEWIKAIRQLAKAAPKLPPEQQEQASRELAQFLVKEREPITRGHMLRTLAAFPTKTAERMLQAGLRDADQDVRVVCCDAWARRGGPEAVRVLSEVLSTDTDLDVRLAAARALGELHDPQAIGALGLALDDDNPAMQLRAIDSLRAISGKNYKTVQEWRSFAQGEKREPLTLTDRLRRLF
ncbi:MAG TPA: HEAT repeat domain-containing protein [Pirellulales bacterium]|nr:HEAT repeat domain-containing protein [Pirellulales bacterium]